jgi:hypothetical protein
MLDRFRNNLGWSLYARNLQQDSCAIGLTELFWRYSICKGKDGHSQPEEAMAIRVPSVMANNRLFKAAKVVTF